MPAFDEKCATCAYEAGSRCTHPPNPKLALWHAYKPGDIAQETMRAEGWMCGPSAALWVSKQTKETQ